VLYPRREIQLAAFDVLALVTTKLMSLEDRDASCTPTVLDVLIVDDSEDMAETLSALLGERGHRVRIAPNGARALEALEQDAPDVVLLDVGLPDMDGYEVAAAMRARFAADLRIVAITGFTSDVVRERARRSGCDACLVKPFDLDEVTAALRAA